MSSNLIDILIKNFDKFLKEFDEHCPFKKPEKLEYHQKTIQLRRKLGSAKNAINDDSFLHSLYYTLRAWGVGLQGSKLKPFPDFVNALKEKTNEIHELDGLIIDDPNLNPSKIGDKIANLLQGLEIVDNKNRIVSSSQAIHHLLPELVVPFARKYTKPFFGWEDFYFQNNPKKCYSDAFCSFVKIARETDPSKYVGEGWRTSRTKVIDNAIVGLVCSFDI